MIRKLASCCRVFLRDTRFVWKRVGPGTDYCLSDDPTGNQPENDDGIWRFYVWSIWAHQWHLGENVGAETPSSGFRWSGCWSGSCRSLYESRTLRVKWFRFNRHVTIPVFLFVKDSLFNWRTKLCQLLCLKYLGKTMREKDVGLDTLKRSPLLFQEIKCCMEGSSSILPM